MTISLYNENVHKSFYFHNVVNNLFLSQFALEIIGESQTIDPEISIIELRNASDSYIIRKQAVEKWVTGSESTYIFYFTKDEGNDTIQAVKFFCNNATETAETGTVASEIITNVTKTNVYNMNIIYTFGFVNG